MASKIRTLSYRKCDWFSNPPTQDLQGLLATALGKAKTVAATKIVRADGSTFKILHRRVSANQPVYLHISIHTPGEAASTLPTNDAVSECDLDTSSAPKGKEFLDGDAMLLVTGNDVIMCVSNMHESTVAYYLREFIKGAKISKDAESFDLLKIANKKIVHKLMKHGVRKITLDAHAFEQSLKAGTVKDRSLAAAAKAGAAKLFGALVNQDVNANRFAAQADLVAAVTLRADMRRHGGGDVIAGRTASKIVDMFDSGYEIETVKGIKITPEEIMVRQKFSFPAHGKTVEYKKVWTQLALFYNQLVADGINV